MSRANTKPYEINVMNRNENTSVVSYRYLTRFLDLSNFSPLSPFVNTNRYTCKTTVRLNMLHVYWYYGERSAWKKNISLQFFFPLFFSPLFLFLLFFNDEHEYLRKYIRTDTNERYKHLRKQYDRLITRGSTKINSIIACRDEEFFLLKKIFISRVTTKRQCKREKKTSNNRSNRINKPNDFTTEKTGEI